MYTKAIYPGTFDPVTNGHLDIIKRACKMFDKIIVAVADNKDKKTMFSLEKRVELMKKATSHLPKIEVESFNSLLVDFAREKECKIIIRGLRAVSDFEYELQMGYANKSLDSEIDTIYLMPNLENAFISSSVVRSILKYNGDVSHLIPNEIIKDL
ncbi:pantetheine-phosphate adenylyltransferase [Nautilia profundicola AmH]|uniref:Phosphopantetheine adenylyltransferase n=1 Tax=Nautilia profundicola (strain ATCC BAA-1463 / DSM 18972 / AmH) TaxID=598659 RepID=COAD_NAUPA|nr:pantetheine-phosphate adenylyltransferase [Nautilia profundicola]B9L9C2.1 RecName: Full=Phosphopantetheine adenylyltransferase; AltName: Full=Dephospho-CoA pyrophosphorylase; AltName: Full=Pantetheine-phosphate adenylyltransferase; Short=PPAT [Nautilia profundicola AmH]ACM93281.1 pantetheine-phosphate adenylyltransferase [Nautilia profundicola AmH]